MLVTEILRLAHAPDHKTLLAIADDLETESLLGLLPRRESRQAEVHLEDARIWRAKQKRKACEKVDAADEALSKLDLVLARGILRKVDASVLGDLELARYDELLLAIEARAMELEEIKSRLRAEPPQGREGRRRGFWNR